MQHDILQKLNHINYYDYIQIMVFEVNFLSIRSLPTTLEPRQSCSGTPGQDSAPSAPSPLDY